MTDQEMEFSKTVVAEVMGRQVTQGELSTVFTAVADKANWKNPINTTVDLDPYGMAMVKKAVIFFTGSVPSFKLKSGGTTTSGMGRYQVKAAGYYATIGA